MNIPVIPSPGNLPALDIMKLPLLEIRKKGENITYGDVIIVHRSIYTHYGIYVNSSSVIHYSSPGSDISLTNNKIIETSFEKFKRDAARAYKIVFPEENSEIMRKIKEALNFWNNYHFYTPQETVSRARSRIGESKYSLGFNNCEHFAIWCKTGLEESSQVDNFLKILAYVGQFGWSQVAARTIAGGVATGAGLTTAATLGTATLGGVSAVAATGVLATVATPIVAGTAVAAGTYYAAKKLYDLWKK